MSREPEKASASNGAATTSQRIDKWLWCARFAKTRTLAGKFATSGAIRLTRDFETARVEKASTSVRVGDRLAFLIGERMRVVEIIGFGERRGPASEARLLYTDHSPPPAPKEDALLPAMREKGAGRPTKKDRRATDRLKTEEA